MDKEKTHMNDRMKKAESVLEMLPGFQYLYKGEVSTETVKYLIKKGWALEAAAIKAVIGTCKFVAFSLKEMELINEAAAGYLAPGHLEVIGISVIAGVNKLWLLAVLIADNDHTIAG